MQPRVLAATQSRVECELHENHPLRLIGAEGRRMKCLSGVLWITAYDQPIDVFLRPGQTYVIPNGGLVLAEAVGEARMQVELPRVFDYAPYQAGVAAAFQRLLGGVRGLSVRRRRVAG